MGGKRIGCSGDILETFGDIVDNLKPNRRTILVEDDNGIKEYETQLGRWSFTLLSNNFHTCSKTANGFCVILGPSF